MSDSRAPQDNNDNIDGDAETTPVVHPDDSPTTAYPADPTTAIPAAPTAPYSGNEPAGAVPAGAVPAAAGAPASSSRWSFVRSHRTAIITGVSALIVGGIIGGGIGWAASGDGDGHRGGRGGHSQMQGDRDGSGQGDRGGRNGMGGMGGGQMGGENGPGMRGGRGVMGEITAINGDTWTVRTGDDTEITVTVGGETGFGTGRAPAERGDFAVGDEVMVAGDRDCDKITATRIAKAPERGTQGNSGAPGGSNTPSAPSTAGTPS
ncbi:DUF5666 domain-containing protein [Gordonia desulfuricans]|nr:DUF5666 domain-containing protein [Gordonia desulfuricans]